MTNKPKLRRAGYGFLDSDHLLTFFSYAIMTLICIIVIYPLILVVSNSVSDPEAVVGGKVTLLPVGFNLESYVKVINNNDLTRGFLNSLLYTVVGTIINVSLTILAAYPLSRSELLGRNALMKIITLTMFFSGGMIPTFLVVRNLRLMNTLWALVLPGAISTYNLIITRTFLQSNIPEELVEAAKIDGCSHARFLVRIVIPLSMAIIVIIAMFYAIGHWNDYMGPIMYFSRKEKYNLQVVLRDILQSAEAANMAESTDTILSVRFYEIERIKYATMVISSLPLALAYPFIMKYFEKGVMMGAIKG